MEAITKTFQRKIEEVWFLRADYIHCIKYMTGNWWLAGSTCYCDFRHCWLSSEGGYCAHFVGNGEWRSRHNWIGRSFLRSHSGWACHSRDQHSKLFMIYLTLSWLSPQIALKNDIDYATVLEQLREARTKGLTIPVLLMGIFEASMILNSELIM